VGAEFRPFFPVNAKTTGPASYKSTEAAALGISIRATMQLLPDGRQPFHNRAPSSRIRLDANAIIDG
jgi:hypothetical protein